jgi:hypothetical protein
VDASNSRRRRWRSPPRRRPPLPLFRRPLPCFERPEASSRWRRRRVPVASSLKQWRSKVGPPQGASAARVRLEERWRRGSAYEGRREAWDAWALHRCHRSFIPPKPPLVLASTEAMGEQRSCCNRPLQGHPPSYPPPVTFEGHRCGWSYIVFAYIPTCFSFLFESHSIDANAHTHNTHIRFTPPNIGNKPVPTSTFERQCRQILRSTKSPLKHFL